MREERPYVRNERPASDGVPYKGAGVARSATLVGTKAVANKGKRGGACLVAHGFSSSDADRATYTLRG